MIASADSGTGTFPAKRHVSSLLLETKPCVEIHFGPKDVSVNVSCMKLLGKQSLGASLSVIFWSGYERPRRGY